MHYLFCPFQPMPTVINSGCAILQPGWKHQRRNLDISVLILGHKGKVQLSEENTCLEILPNRLLLLTAGRWHQGSAVLDAMASYYWLHFTLPSCPVLFSVEEAAPILYNPQLAKQRLANAALLPQQMDVANAEHLVILFRQLLQEQEYPAYTPWHFQLIFQELLITITESTLHNCQPPTDITAGSSLAYATISTITANLTDPNLSIKSIANYLKYNPDYIGKQFRTAMGMSVGSYILQQRMKLAEQLLQENTSSITTVAQSCGFTSMRHFLRQFKHERGTTPSEFRRKRRAMHINMY